MTVNVTRFPERNPAAKLVAFRDRATQRIYLAERHPTLNKDTFLWRVGAEFYTHAWVERHWQKLVPYTLPEDHPDHWLFVNLLSQIKDPQLYARIYTALLETEEEWPYREIRP